MMYCIEARLPWQSEFTFDPSVVLRRLIADFPELVVCLDDRAWNHFDSFHSRGVVLGELWTPQDERDPEQVSPSRHRVRQMAAHDARRRGPVWTFRIHWSNDQAYRGKVEREIVSLWSDDPFPDDLLWRFLNTLNNLRFVPPEVSAYALEGNHREPLPHSR